MRISSLDIQDFRSFRELKNPLEFGSINVLVGANNSGKSSILKAIHLIQDGAELSPLDVRIGAIGSKITIGLTDVLGISMWGGLGSSGDLSMDIQLTGSADRRSIGVVRTLRHDRNGSSTVGGLQPVEPEHFVIPYFSKRKTVSFSEDVRNDYALTVAPNLMYLSAKLSRISNPAFPGHEVYRDTCKEILGFMVTAIPSQNGQRPGVYLANREALPIDQMGEGVPNIVGLLADLALSENKLFLIGEPENDLHPAALKALLGLIIESSNRNQFVISTHSNIVVSYLCAAAGSTLYNIQAPRGVLPTEAEAIKVPNNAESRLSVLRDLGYSFSDFELWDGWLILEEASAERIIRDYLIPWFVPKLARVRTLSTNGVDQIASTFEDFNRLVRFTHLERAYAGAAWVRVDGDAAGKSIVDQLQGRYKSWAKDHFACFEQSQFESYYPEHFSDRVSQTLSITDQKKKREAKRILLEDVRVWLDEDTSRAKAALRLSAKEIVDDLEGIAASLRS